MQPHNNDFIITIEELENAGFSYNTVKVAVQRSRVEKVCRGQYLWSSLVSHGWGERIKAALWQGMEPSVWLLKQAEAQEARAQQTLEAQLLEVWERGYKLYTYLYKDLGLRGDSLNRLCRAHGMLLVLDARKPAGRGTETAFWQQAGEFIKQHAITCLPTHYVRLKEAWLRFVEGGKKVAAKMLGNSNAATFKLDKEVVGWTLKMRADARNYTNALITKHVQGLCRVSGKPVPSESWFADFFAQPWVKELTATARWDWTERMSQKYRAYVHMESPMYAGDSWLFDGTRWNSVGYKGKKGTEFLYVVVAMDAMSGDIVGEWFGVRESAGAYIDVVKQAVANNKYLPEEMVFDRFPGHNSEDWLCFESLIKEMGCTVRYTSAATGKAKVERMFGTLQTVFMQTDMLHYGEGIRSTRSYAHRRKDYVAQAQKIALREGFDFEASANRANEVLQAYRHSPYSAWSKKHKDVGESPAQLHESSMRPNVRILKESELALISHEVKTIQIQHASLMVTMAGQQYHYRLERTILSQYTALTIAIDPAKPETVWCFAPQTLQCLGQLTQIVLIAAGDVSGVKKEKQLLKKQDDARKTELESIVGMARPTVEYADESTGEVISRDIDEVSLLSTGLVPKADALDAESSWVANQTSAEKPKKQAKNHVTKRPVAAPKPIIVVDNECDYNDARYEHFKHIRFN